MLKKYYDFKKDIERESWNVSEPSIQSIQKSMDDRFQSDILLNRGNQDDSTSPETKKIRDLQEELNTMRNKMKFVFEKDEEIQTLKQKLNKSKLALDKTSAIMEEKRRLQDEVNSLSKKNRALSEDNLLLKSKESLIEQLQEELSKYRANDNAKDNANDKAKDNANDNANDNNESNIETDDEMIYIKNKYSFMNIIRKNFIIHFENKLHSLIYEYTVENGSSIPKQALSKLYNSI